MLEKLYNLTDQDIFSRALSQVDSLDLAPTKRLSKRSRSYQKAQELIAKNEYILKYLDPLEQARLTQTLTVAVHKRLLSQAGREGGLKVAANKREAERQKKAQGWLRKLELVKASSIDVQHSRPLISRIYSGINSIFERVATPRILQLSRAVGVGVLAASTLLGTFLPPSGNEVYAQIPTIPTPTRLSTIPTPTETIGVIIPIVPTATGTSEVTPTLTPTPIPTSEFSPTLTPDPQAVTYRLENGLNFIGVPVNTPLTTIGDLLDQTKNTLGGRVCDEVRVMDVANPDARQTVLSPSARIIAGLGYFVKCAQSASVSISGPNFTETDQNLQARFAPGWQWRSLARGSLLNAESFLQKVSSSILNCKEVNRWTGGNWDGHTRGNNANNFQMNDREGYAVRCEEVAQPTTTPTRLTPTPESTHEIASPKASASATAAVKVEAVRLPLPQPVLVETTASVPLESFEIVVNQAGAIYFAGGEFYTDESSLQSDGKFHVKVNKDMVDRRYSNVFRTKNRIMFQFVPSDFSKSIKGGVFTVGENGAVIVEYTNDPKASTVSLTTALLEDDGEPIENALVYFGFNPNPVRTGKGGLFTATSRVRVSSGDSNIIGAGFSRQDGTVGSAVYRVTVS